MGKLLGAGVNQGDLVDLFVLFKTNFAGVTAKLDLDGGVSDTDYASTLSLSLPAGIKTSGAKAIKDQGQIYNYLILVRVEFNALLAKLDLDGTVNQTDFVSTYAMPSLKIRPAGMDQGQIINICNSYLTKFNLMLAHLDTDSGVSGTNYASLWAISDTVDETGTHA